MGPQIRVDKNNLTALVTVRYDKASKTMHGLLDVRDANGVRLYKALVAVPIEPIRTQAMELLKDRPGWGLGSIVKAAKSIAKKTGVTQLVKVTDKVLSNPALAGVVPSLGVSYSVVRKGATLLNKAKARDPAAVAQVQKLATAAKANNPTAAKALTLLNALNVAQNSGKDIEAWANYLARQYKPPAEVSISGYSLKLLVPDGEPDDSIDVVGASDGLRMLLSQRAA